MVTRGAWDGIAAAISSDRAVLSPPACRLLVRLLDYYVNREVGTLPPALVHVRSVLELVGSSGVDDTTCGHADVRKEPASAWSTHDEIGTEQAAALLGCSREHANRLARSGALGPTRKVGNRRTVQRTHVDAYSSTRA